MDSSDVSSGSVRLYLGNLSSSCSSGGRSSCSSSSSIMDNVDQSQSSSEDSRPRRRQLRERRRQGVLVCRCHLCFNVVTQRGRLLPRHVWETHQSGLHLEDETTDEGHVSFSPDVSSSGHDSDVHMRVLVNNRDSTPTVTSESESEDFTSSTSESESPLEEDLYDNVNVMQTLHDDTEVSVLTTIVLLFSFGFKNNLGLGSIESLFDVVSCILPKPNRFPSFHMARRLLNNHGHINVTTYDICMCGKVMFRNKPARFDTDNEHQYKDLLECPLCGQSRQTPSGKKTTTKYSHIGLISQLKGVFWDPDWRDATILRGNPNSEVMRSIHDSPAWNDFLQQNPSFSQNPRNLLLSFCTDGINPFKKKGFSMWPQMFKVLNLEPHLASKTSLMFLSGVIHGPKEPTSMKPVLEIIKEELLDLWHGIPVPNPNQPEQVEIMRACLFCTSGDYPGHSKTNSLQGTGSINGCMECTLQGTKPVVYNRMIYGGYRRYLPMDHPWRSDPSFGGEERRDPPVRKTHEWVVYWGKVADEHGQPKRKTHPVHRTGVSGSCPLSSLPGPGDTGFFDIVNFSLKDLMHSQKGVLSHFNRFLFGYVPAPLKLKRPREPERKEEQGDSDWESRLSEYNSKLAKYEEAKREHQEVTRYIKDLVVSSAMIKLAHTRYKSVMGRPGFLGTSPLEGKSIKMHESHVWMTSGLGRMVMSPPVLTPKIYKVFCGLCDLVSLLGSYEVNRREFEAQYTHVVEVLCLFERDIPPTSHCILLHLLLEIYGTIKRVGPVQYYWMYVFERYVGRLSRMIKDRGHPETNLVNVYTLKSSVDYITRVQGNHLRVGLGLNSHQLLPPVDIGTSMKDPLLFEVYFPDANNRHLKHLSPERQRMVCELLESDHRDINTYFNEDRKVYVFRKGVKIKGEICGTLEGEGGEHVHRKSRYFFSFLCFFLFP